MNVDGERSRSLWMQIPPRPAPALDQDAKTDILVIGAGIAGLSTAYELARLGRTVMVVDRGAPARGMSARTSAHLAFELDDFYAELTKLRGVDASRQFYESQSAAVDRIEAIVASEGIACDFARVDGWFVPADARDVGYLRRELEAARAAGFLDAEWREEGPGPWCDAPALRFPRQARFHPTKYLNGLISLLDRAGVRLFADTPIVAIEETEGGVWARAENGRAIEARAAVVAANTPFHLRVQTHTKQAPYRTYVLAARLPKGEAPDALVWDTLEPAYHYVRVQPERDFDWLIAGGEDHKTGEARDMEDRLEGLEAWTRRRFPKLGAVEFAWSGQVFEPADYAPFIGRSPGAANVFLVSGDSGQGLTTGVAASLILRDLVRGIDNPWADVYDPARSVLRAGLGEFVKENADAARHWAAHLMNAEIESVDDLAPGEGAIVKIGAARVAAYRRENGSLALLDAACTHAGCVVRFNAFERCWDCPCHGSQFSVEGEPLQGPACRPLAAARIPAETGGRPNGGARRRGEGPPAERDA